MKLSPDFIKAKYHITFEDNDDFRISAKNLRELVTDFADSFGPLGGDLSTAQLLGLDPATDEFLVLLSPSAPKTESSYVLAEYAAPPGTGYALAPLPIGAALASRLLRVPVSARGHTLCLLDAAGEPVPLTGLEIKAEEDERFSLLSTTDPAVPESEVHGLINWKYEVAPATGSWELKPGKSVMFTVGSGLTFPADVQEGDIFGVYINPPSATTRISLATTGGIDELPTKRYTKGMALVLRYRLVPDYTTTGGQFVAAHYGLETLQQTTPTAVNSRGAFAPGTYYLPGDLVSFHKALYLRQVEGSDTTTFDPTKWVGSAASGLLTTAREDVFVDPTYAIPATYLNTALTLRTYNQASVAVTLPALTPQLVPALLRLEHQTGLGGTTCLLRVPGVARPLRVGEYVLLAATATPGIPPNPSTGDPGLPPGTAWVELNASAQLLDPLSYPVMVGTRSLGYVGYPTLEAAAFAAPFRPLVVNVPSLLISKDMAITGNLYSAGTQLVVEDGITLSIGMGLTLHKVAAVANGSGKVQLTSSQASNITPTASQALQLVDSLLNLPVVFSAAAHGVTLRGTSALAAPQGSTGVVYLYDLAESITAGGPTVVDRRPGAASASVFSYAARRYETASKVQLGNVYTYGIPCSLVLPGSNPIYASNAAGFVIPADGFYGLKGHAHMVFPGLGVYAEVFFYLNGDGGQRVGFNQITPRDVGGGLLLGTEQVATDVYLTAGTTVGLGYSDGSAGSMYPRSDAPGNSCTMSIIRLA